MIDNQPPTELSPDADMDAKLSAGFAPTKQTVTDRETGYDWRIQDWDSDGNTVITVSYAFIRVATTVGREVQPSLQQFGSQEVVNPGETFVWDTRFEIMASNPRLRALGEQPADQQPPGIAQKIASLERLRALGGSLIERPFTIVVSPQGELLAVRGIDVIMDQFRNELSKDEMERSQRAKQDAWIEAFFGDDTVNKTLTLNLLLPYSAEAVSPEDTWSDSHEFEVSGMKVTVTRKMRLDGAPNPDGGLRLAGVIGMGFQAAASALYKDRLVIESRGESLRLTADVDSTTGMYRKLSSDGTFKFTARVREAAAGAAPAIHVDQHVFSSAVAARFARRDPSDKKFLLFGGGNGAYQLRLGLDWSQNSIGEKIGTLLGTVYRQAVSGAQLNVSVAPPLSSEDELKQPLNEDATRVKTLLERAWHGKQIKLSWSKLFETGPVRWSRCRLEIMTPNGEQMAYWNQVGYGPQGHYTFELTRPGAPSDESDKEVMGILDSIVTPDPNGP